MKKKFYTLRDAREFVYDVITKEQADQISIAIEEAVANPGNTDIQIEAAAAKVADEASKKIFHEKPTALEALRSWCGYAYKQSTFTHEKDREQIQEEEESPDLASYINQGGEQLIFIPLIFKIISGMSAAQRKESNFVDTVFDKLQSQCNNKLGENWQAKYGQGAAGQGQILKMIDLCLEEISNKEKTLRNTDSNICMEKFKMNVTTDNKELLIWTDNMHWAGAVVEDGQEAIVERYLEDIDPDMDTPRANAVLDKIKRQRGLSVKRSEFDKQNGMAFKNGWVNYDTYELEANSPEHLNRIFIDSKIEMIDQIEKEWEQKDIEKILEDTLYWKSLKECFTIDGKFDFKACYTFLETRAFGLGIFKKLEKEVWHLGRGANGKSVFMQHWAAMLGDYVSFESPIDLAENRFRVANLEGMLGNVCFDMDIEVMKKTGLLKKLSSGEKLSAERKGQDSFKMKPFALVETVTNGLGATTDYSDGWFRKQIIIQWKRQFEDKDRNLDLLSQLVKDEDTNAKLLGLLVRIREKLYKRGKFIYAEGIDDTKKLWQEHSMPLEQFEKECVKPADGIKTLKRDLYNAYTKYCEDRGLRPKSKSMVTKYFKDQYEEEYKDEAGVTARAWADMKLVEFTDDDLRKHC